MKVLPSVKNAQKRRGVFSLFIFSVAVNDMISASAPLISSQLKTTTKRRYTVAPPGGRHRQTGT